MPHNESRIDRPVEEPQTESTQPSKLSRAKRAAINGGITLIPVVLAVAPAVIMYRTGQMNLESAKLNLDTAKIANAAANAVQQS